jgi:MoxR-like ATPase
VTVPSSSPATRLPKLGAGELRNQVLATTASEADRQWTVTEIAKALGGRSGGAVGEALKRLDADGLVALLPGSPRRYQVTTLGERTAAGLPAPAAPLEPAPAAPTPTEPPAPDEPVPPRPGAVLRPGGAWYLPRRLAGGTDIEVLRRLRSQRLPALLYGPPGTGKTSLVEAAFNDVLTVGGHGDTTVEDFLGSYVPQPDGTFTFTYGPLVVAMREGRALFVDDGTLIPPRVLAVLYPVMDGRGTITIPAHHHEPVHAVDGFYVAFGHNPGVHGAVLTEALASRLAVHIEVTTDFALARSLGVPDKAVTVAEVLNAKLRAGEISWAPQLRELLAFQRIAATLGVDAAAANLVAIAPEEDRPDVLAAVKVAFGRTVTPLTLGEQR